MSVEHFTATGFGKKHSVGSVLPSKHAIQVNGVGGALSSWTIILQGSQDGTTWTTLLTHNATDGSIVYPADAIERPVRFLRVNVSALSLGTTATAAQVTVVSKA